MKIINKSQMVSGLHAELFRKSLDGLFGGKWPDKIRKGAGIRGFFK